MDHKIYTTGELAALCNVSTRTVQYYDKEGLVRPSQLSEGGRRIYSEEDVQKFRLVCLYKNLGFSLAEIKNIFISEDAYEVVSDLILQQQQRLYEQVETIAEQKKRLAAIQEDISDHQFLSVANEEELQELMSEQDKCKRINKAGVALRASLLAILILSNFLVGFMELPYRCGLFGMDIGVFLVVLIFHITTGTLTADKHAGVSSRKNERDGK